MKAAFESRPLSILVGLLTIGIATVSSAAVALGSAGYIQQFLDWPRDLIVIAVVILLGAVAAWGILESVVLASLFTLIEVGGLVAIIAFAVYSDVPIGAALSNVPPLEATALSGIAFGSLLAFFAFIRFKDLANVVEEAEQPYRDIPRAMVLTLLISTARYVLVAAVAVCTMSIERLALSPAPLSLVFRAVAEVNPMTISLIAIVATLNTILAQMTMASRVIYGLARGGFSASARACVCRHGNARRGNFTDCGLCDSARAVGPIRLAGGRNFAGNSCGLRHGQYSVAKIEVSRRIVGGATCLRTGLGSWDGRNRLSCNDRKLAS